MPTPRFKRPDMRLRDAREAANRHDGDPKKGVRKEVTTVKASGDAEYGSGICRPTDEELALINQYTRTPKTADEVVVFSTLSCNDLEDRDLDAFTTQTVKDFASLPAPYGPNGKSFMVSHDYSKLPVGRIFDTDTRSVDSATFLTNKVYMPNTEQYKSFIENQDFGIYWAVSVGVMLDDNHCSVCEGRMSSWGGYCFNGHIKGMWYPEGDEGDPSGWDWADPVEEGAKGAVKCIGVMEGARDFYELSQCFLGAQFFAELEKSPGTGGLIKAAAASKVPFVNLGSDDAAKIPLQHVPQKVAEAQQKYDTEADEDGIVRWTDESGLVWTYNPETSEVLCLGKASDSADEDGEEDDDDAEGDHASTGGDEDVHAEGSGEPEADGADDGSAGQRLPDDGDADGGSGDSEVESGQDGDLTAEDPDDESDEDESDDDADTEDDEEEDKEVDKQALLKALRKAKAPAVMLSAVAEADGNGLDAVLRAAAKTITDQDTEIKALQPKAAVGEQYLKDVTAEAIDWYVKAHQDGREGGVNTESFERLLTRCGDDVELVKSLLEEQKNLARAKFPEAVRRSSFPDDANSRKEPSAVDTPDTDSDRKVSRLHS